MIIGQPIPTAGLRVRDMDRLTMQLRQAIAEMYYSRSKSASLPDASGEARSQPLLTPNSDLQRKEPT
jgi:hypothetical protein